MAVTGFQNVFHHSIGNFIRRRLSGVQSDHPHNVTVVKSVHF